MRQTDFDKLTPVQQLTLLIAMHVRDEMEDFHVKYLSDAQMKELNPIIRQAIFDVVNLTYGEAATKTDKRQRAYSLHWLTMMIPDYWEIPEKTTGHLELPEDRINKLFDDPNATF